MNAPTEWVSAVAILAAGLILGLIFVILSNRRRTKASTLGSDPDIEFRDLEAKRDALILQLRDLDQKSSPAERTRLELETAEVLRQIDGHGRGSRVVPSDEVEVAEASPMNPALRGFLWGAVSFAVLAGLGYFVMQSASPREEGGLATGGLPSQSATQRDPMLEQIQAAVMRNPEDLQLRNDFAQALLERDDLMGVFEQTKFVLDRAPEDSRALTFQALVRLAMGEADTAISMLQRASQSDPKNLDSWVGLAWIYAQSDRMDEAEAMMAEAGKQSPQDKQRLDEVFAQMKVQIAQMKDAPPPGGDLPAGHPPIDGQLPAGHPPVAPAAGAAPATAMATPASPGDGRSIQVTLELDPAARVRSGVLYVMARPPAGGPPVAVKRMQVSTFPVTFDFGAADSMMGQPLPDRFLLEARLDSDGDAATRSPNDPSATQQNVAPGASVRLALR
jgi:cytochrome c-type biogenesis protein CcmH